MKETFLFSCSFLSLLRCALALDGVWAKKGSIIAPVHLFCRAFAGPRGQGVAIDEDWNTQRYVIFMFW